MTTASLLLVSMLLVSAGPAESDVPKRVAHPTKVGRYVNGAWEYEHHITGDNLKHRYGKLTYKGRQVTRPMGSVLDTPLGRFMSFDLQGGQIGYNTGWLMTAVIHADRRSNVVVPVFLDNGEVNPQVLATLPIKKENIRAVSIKDL